MEKDVKERVSGIEEKVREIVLKHVRGKIGSGEIGDRENLVDLGFDSLDFAEIPIDIREAFGYDIKFEDKLQNALDSYVKTYGQLVSFVRGYRE